MRKKLSFKYEDIYKLYFHNIRKMNYQNINQSNMYQQNTQHTSFANYNPKSFDPKLKNQLVNQNIYHSGYGNYKVCPVMISVKFPYKNTYNPGPINNVCRVIVHNKHALDVASDLCDHGLSSLTSRKPIPAIMYPMGKEFLGTNLESREGIYDENIILRTNYPYVIKKQNDLFPIKEGHKAVIYSNPITIIRDSNYNPLSYDDIFKVAIITVCYDRKNELMSITEKIKDEKNKKEKNREIKMLASSDLLNFQMYIETVFQAAFCGNNDILIMSLFGIEFDIPIDDQILIFNMCIMKFGHMFKGIMICIPPYEGKDVFEYFDREIIKPHNLTKDIEMKYTAEAMTQRMKNNEDENENVDDSDKDDESDKNRKVKKKENKTKNTKERKTKKEAESTSKSRL